MAARTVKLGFVVYTDTQGRPLTGYLGEDVDVHKEDLERFDRLNVLPDIDKVVAPEAVLTQSDVDAAVQAAQEAKDTELAEAKDALDKDRQALDAEKAEFERAKAEAQTGPAAKPTAAKQPATKPTAAKQS